METEELSGRVSHPEYQKNKDKFESSIWIDDFCYCYYAEIFTVLSPLKYKLFIIISTVLKYQCCIIMLVA